jgi:hypothetical protein
MEHDKAPGPDGFPAEFFQNFWDTIKGDLFGELHAGQLELLRINIGEIILLQKINNTERIEQFKPICLLNVFFNIH